MTSLLSQHLVYEFESVDLASGTSSTIDPLGLIYSSVCAASSYGVYRKLNIVFRKSVKRDDFQYIVLAQSTSHGTHVV